MLRTVRNISLTIIILLIVFGAAGFAYLYFTGGSNNIKSDQATAYNPTSTELPKPPKPSPNAPESAAIESLFTPVKIGSNTSMAVKTLPNSTCNISFIYNNIASKDSGLTSKKANDYGSVSWSWTIDGGVPVGTWPAKVTCFYGKKSAVVIGNVQVTK